MGKPSHNIRVVYTHRELTPRELLDKNSKNSGNRFNTYIFNTSNACLRVGDIITSPDYSTPIQVIDIQEGIIEKVGPILIKTINISNIRFPYVYEVETTNPSQKVLVKSKFHTKIDLNPKLLYFHDEPCIAYKDDRYKTRQIESIKLIKECEADLINYPLLDDKSLGIAFDSPLRSAFEITPSKVIPKKAQEEIKNPCAEVIQNLEEKEQIKPLKNTVMNTKKPIFKTIIEKFKSQFMPKQITGLKVAMDGTLCVQFGNEFTGFKGKELVVYPEAMCMDMPIYTISKQLNQVVIGDTIRVRTQFLKVIGINKDNSLRCISYTGTTVTKKEIKDALLNQTLVEVVVNMSQSIGTNNTMNPMMMMLLSEGESEDNSKMETMMMAMIMGQMNQSNTGTNNPMENISPLMFAMMGKDGLNEGDTVMEKLMIMQMMGGQNPFNQMFSTCLNNKSAE